MARKPKSLFNGHRPPAPKRECQACEYFIRKICCCGLHQRETEPTGTCGGWEFRQACRVCGCSHFDPCPEGCWWVEPDLCSACAPEPKRAA